MTMPFLPTIFRDRITWLETFVECDSSIRTVPNYEKFCIFDYMRIFTSSDTSTGISQGMPKLIASSPGKKIPRWNLALHLYAQQPFCFSMKQTYYLILPSLNEKLALKSGKMFCYDTQAISQAAFTYIRKPQKTYNGTSIAIKPYQIAVAWYTKW